MQGIFGRVYGVGRGRQGLTTGLTSEVGKNCRVIKAQFLDVPVIEKRNGTFPC